MCWKFVKRLVLLVLLIYLTRYPSVELDSDGLIYLIPKDPIIYQDFDPVIQLCRGTHTSYCNAVDSSEWNCTFQLLESDGCTPNCKRQVAKSLIASKDLFVGLNRISCNSPTGKVEQIKLFIRDRQTRLDCAAVPAVFHVQQTTHSSPLCVKHIPLRATWLKRFPQLKSIGFQDVLCNSTVDHLKFDKSGLLLHQVERIPSGIHLIECENAKFRVVFHQKTGRPKSDLVPVATVLGSQLEKIQLLDPHMVNNNLEPTYDVTKQSCVTVNQAPGAVQYIPVWDHLHGPAHYKVYNSEKDEHAFAQLTVLASDRAVTTSTFRCQLYEGGKCYSKLWLYSHIRPVLPIRLRPLDRLQTFFGSLTCDLPDVPANMLCVQLQVQWGLRAFVIVSNNKANWTRLDRTSRRFLLSCQASACYMGRVYGQQTEQMLVHVTATVRLNFNPTRDVYWQTDKLTCEVNNSDRKVQPYMVVVTYPINFRPRLSYKTIHFQEFIPGEYEIKCYYFGPSLGDMPRRFVRTFVQLITGYDAVAQLVCILVRQSRNTEHPFVLHDFDWTMRVRSRTLMRPDLSLTKERKDSDHSFKPTVIFIPSTSLKRLHRVHSQGISSSPSISSPDLTPENPDSAKQGEEVAQQLTLVSLQKNQSPKNKQIEAEYDGGNVKPDGLVIRHRKKKKRCKRALTVPDYLRREVVRMMMMKRRSSERKQQSKNGS